MSGPARVALLINDLRRGGAEAQLAELAAGLDRRTYEPSVVLLKSRNDYAARLQEAGVAVTALGKRGWWDLAVLWHLYQHLRRERPDVLHSYLFHPNLVAALVGRAAGCRALVLSQRGSYDSNLPLPAPGLWRAAARWANRRAGRLVANSEAVAREERAAGLPPDRVTVIPNGVAGAAPSDVDRAALGLPAGPLALAVGRLEPVKGHCILVAAWQGVAAACPDATLVIVGEGSRQAALRAEVASRGLEGRVLLTGARPALPYLAACDLLVHPSLSEGMPNVVLEAMALGKPVLASRVGGLPEVVADSETGVLVPAGDPSALSAAIQELLADAPRRRALGEAGRRRARERFSAEAMVAATAAVYDDLLGRGSRAGRRILFFGHRPYPNDHGLLEAVFTRELPARGYHPVWVLQPARPELSGHSAAWNGTPVYVTRRRYWRGPLRHVELFYEYLRLGERAVREHAVDLVQARTGLPEALAAWHLARRHGLPFVYQCSYPIPLSRREALKARDRPLAAAALYAIESRLVDALARRADLVLAISDAMAAALRERGIPAVPFPLGADTAVDPASVTPVAAPGETVVYFGSMDRKRDLGVLLDVFRRVLEEVPSAHLLLVGDEAGSSLRESARRLGLADHVTFAGRVPRVEVPRYLRAARCSVAAIPPRPLYLVSSSTKVVESLGMGVPVVANREIPDQREIVETSGGGLAPPYDPAALAGAVVALLKDPAEAARRGEAGRRFVCEHRSYGVLSRALAERYDTLLAGRSR